MATVTHQIARVLADRGLGPGDVVAVSIPRSPRMVLTMLGVAMSGAAFVIIDARLPVRRRAAMLADSDAALVITVDSVVAADRAAEPDAAPQQRDTSVRDLGVEEWLLDDLEVELNIAGRRDHPVTDADRTRRTRVDDLAYLLFTSGSTGRPKAAAVTHAGLAEMVAEQQARLGATPASRVVQLAAPGFGVAVWEIILAICAGAELVISPPDVFAGPELEDVIARHRVTHAVATPTALATIDPASVPDVETIMVAGRSARRNWSLGGMPMAGAC